MGCEVLASRMRLIVLLPVLALPLTGCASSSGHSELAARRAAIAEAGTQVMPFDLARTTHHFEKQEDGGVQTVVSDDGDADQIRLIREHLSMEAERFSRGDFHDPAMLHGHDMPGLHALVMGAHRMDVTYAEVERGGEIRYRTGDDDLIEAIHAWFDAQLRDHGAHATGHRHGGRR